MTTSAIAALKRLGRGPLEQSQWHDYRGMGLASTDVSALLGLALQKTYDDDGLDDVEAYGSIHAWRALVQLQDERAIRILLKQMCDEFAIDWWLGDLPDIMAELGEAAIPLVAARLRATANDPFQLGALAEGLALVAKRQPALRPRCLEVIAGALREHANNAPELNALLVACLVNLRAVELAPLMEAAFAADHVDWSVSGDWEAVQVNLGLLAARRTPKPDFHARLPMTASRVGDDVD